MSSRGEKLSSDAKTERLLNLTLALLASSRYLKKSELFRVIPGYEGSSETMERMFERDKDELRNIGIPIEVEQIDPLFEDEHGYRINPDAYQIQLPEMTASEALLISAALQALSLVNASDRIKTMLSVLSQSSQNEQNYLVGKIRNYLPSLPMLLLEDIYRSIHVKKRLQFQYQSEQGGSFTDRIVSPYGIGSKNGHWYLVAFDHSKDGVRTFNIAQMISLTLIDQDVSPAPIDFALEKELEGFQTTLRSITFSIPAQLTSAFKFEGGEVINLGEDRTLMKIDHSHPISFFKVLLSYSNQVAILSPDDIKQEFSAYVRMLRNG